MQCKRCLADAVYAGIGKQPSTRMFHHVWKCNKCKTAYVENPGSKNMQTLIKSKPMQKGIKLYESFNFKPADKVYMKEISLPGKNNPLVHLGHIAFIGYISDKEGKKGQVYVHKTDFPHPDFYVTADGKTFILANGKMKVQAGWLYY
jgi:hypothetical protein